MSSGESPDPVALPHVALIYADDAYRETARTERPQAQGRPLGLMGRQVAGKAFLDAYLAHGRWSELTALVADQRAARSLLESCRGHPSSRNRSRRLRTIETSRFHDEYPQSDRPAAVIHAPCPPDSRFAWVRKRVLPGAYCLTGVTHTLCTDRAIRQLRELVTSPYEPYDAVICTSRAVLDMVRVVIDTCAEELRERFGGRPRCEAQLVRIPLGVETSRFRPASPEERRAERRRLGVSDDEVVVLFVGRLSHHAKANPFAVYRSLSRAASEANCRATLVMAGWSANEAIRSAFEDGASRFAEGIRVVFVEGDDPERRFTIWRAADIFTSLADSIQETFGLTVLEAMSSGLPVVASDWDGYRDLVVDGETGFLVRTRMVAGSSLHLTSRYMFGEITYDRFLAECSQLTSLDVSEATSAFRDLFLDPDLRKRQGEAGRHRALALFDWSRIIRSYESLWTQLNGERLERLARDAVVAGISRPGIRDGDYPEIDRCFRSYPSGRLDVNDRLERTPDALHRLNSLIESPLTNHSDRRRVHRRDQLITLIEFMTKPITLLELERLSQGLGLSERQIRATVSWLLKYDLIRVHPDEAHLHDVP